MFKGFSGQCQNYQVTNSDYAPSAWLKHLIGLNKRLRGLMNVTATVTEAVSVGRLVVA